MYVLRDIPVDERHPDCSGGEASQSGGHTTEEAGAKPPGKRVERSKKGKNSIGKKNAKEEEDSPGNKKVFFFIFLTMYGLMSES